MTDPANKRYTVQSKAKIKNLTQYRNMSDDEFDELWEKKTTGIVASQEFEKRIKRKIDEFAQDYDLDDLKANDKLNLRALAQAYITLEDLEAFSFEQRAGGIDESDILFMAKVSEVMSKLRNDISSMQNDLKITRRIRKGDKEESVINYLEDLKIKAKKFYDQKMSYIFCPKCGMLLGTVWTLYPSYRSNRIILTCHRKMDDGSTCGGEISINTKELMDMKGSNRPELLPEGIS